MEKRKTEETKGKEKMKESGRKEGEDRRGKRRGKKRGKPRKGECRVKKGHAEKAIGHQMDAHRSHANIQHEEYAF